MDYRKIFLTEKEKEYIGPKIETWVENAMDSYNGDGMRTFIVDAPVVICRTLVKGLKNERNDRRDPSERVRYRFHPFSADDEEDVSSYVKLRMKRDDLRHFARQF